MLLLIIAACTKGEAVDSDTAPACVPAFEACNGVDDDCDGDVDEGLDWRAWWTDADADGFGAGSGLVTACLQPEGTVDQPGDCDDADASVNPDAQEVCNDADDDCDGAVDGGTTGNGWLDLDSDGYGDPAAPAVGCDERAVGNDDDCDDADPAVRPGATEGQDDGIDQDCDGLELCPADADGDGWAGSGTALAAACPAKDGDCADDDAAVNPGAKEDCATEGDDNCDGAVNGANSAGCTTWYTDKDGDGWGVSPSACLCDPTASLTASNPGDCDDVSAADYPSATEIADNDDDEDCDGVDACYADNDKDGYGDSALVDDDGDWNCNEKTIGEADDPNDCDDGEADTFPGAARNESAVQCMNDDDGDDWGDATVGAGVTAGTDCDDTAPGDYPGSTEIVANGDDEDCDGFDLCYEDADGDTYGSTVEITDDGDFVCSSSGEADDDDDCDDANSSTWPGAPETPADGIDSDCDGSD